MELIKKEKIKIAIIGAGAAGLSCANFLENNGDFEIKLFEASNRIGGRILDLKPFGDFPIELGGEFIHGKTSEFYKLAVKAGCEIIALKDREKNIYCEYKGKINNLASIFDNKVDEYFKFFWETYEDVSEKCEKDYPDISVKDYFISKNFPEDFNYLLDALFGTEYSTDIDKLSMKNVLINNRQWTSGSKDYFIKNMSNIDIFKKNYSNIIDKIQFNTQITKINYSELNSVILFDQNNIEYKFNKCVLAIPFNQLSKISYIPSLLEQKIFTLKQIEINRIGKVLLKFKIPFWEKNTTFILLSGPVNIYWPFVRGNDHIITGLVGGTKCYELTNIYKNDKQTFINNLLEPLENLFNDKSIKNNFIDCFWIDWGEEKFIEAGYSHPCINEKDNRAKFIEPINNNLFFAGEAIAKFNKSTIHGAIQSGIETANLILKNL